MAGVVDHAGARGTWALAVSAALAALDGAVERAVRIGDLVIHVLETSDVDRDLDEAIAAGRTAPYGRVLWPSAHAAAEQVSALPLAGRSVVEIGAGCGLVSLVCAARGARVLATDVDERALAWLEHAAAAQALSLATQRFDVLADAPLPAADVVVCADLLYEEHLARAVARRVHEAHARGSEVVLFDPGRVSREAFLRELSRAGVSASFVGEPVGRLVISRAGA
jgi:predicted nicotinamide N-methyase